MNTAKKILIIDDDPTQTMILGTYLRSIQPLEVIEEQSAVEALKFIEREKDHLSLIVTDLRMPEIDGAELLRNLREIAYSGQIIIISSLPQEVIDSTARLAKLHKLDILGSCRKPLTKHALDSTFLRVKQSPKVNQDLPFEMLEKGVVLEALQNGMIRPAFQPQIDVYSRQIVGVEALARWVQADGSVTSPAKFMPAIEEYGLTGELTQCILDQALSAAADWKKSGLNLRVAVNITAIELSKLDFPDIILASLKANGIKPANLVLEVTENITLTVNAVSLEVLSRLRILGVQIAIDDFGTGFSNIKTLRDFPYTELKIDQSFVKSATKDRFSQETIRTAVTLGRELNMRLLAEGVETKEEWDFVKQNGIDEVQGFLIAKPMPAESLKQFYLYHKGMISFEDADEDHQQTG